MVGKKSIHAGEARNDFRLGSRETEHEWNVMSGVVAKPLPVAAVWSSPVGHALVRGVDQDGVIGQAQFLDLFHHASDVGIEVLDLSIQFQVSLDALGLQLSDQFLRAAMRRVGHWRRHKAKEGLILLLLGLDVIHGPIEQDVGAIAFARADFPVMDEGRVEEGVAVVVLHLPDASATMDKYLVESTILRPVRVAEAEVPLAKDGAVVAMWLEKLR